MIERRIKHRNRFGGQIRTYRAFSEEEAEANHIPYVYWRDHHYTVLNGDSEPFYVLSDDGVVVPIHTVGFTKVAIVLRSAFGTFILPRFRKKDAKMTVLAENRGFESDFVSKKHYPFNGLKRVIATMSAHGLAMDEIVDSLCEDNSGRRAKLIRKIYKTEEISNMIREEVKTILTNVGLTEESVVKMLLEAHEVAKDKKDAANMIRAIENLVDMYGLKEKEKETVTQQVSLDTTVEDLARLEKVKEHIKLEQKTEKE